MTVVNAIREVAGLGMMGVTMGAVPVLSFITARRNMSGYARASGSRRPPGFYLRRAVGLHHALPVRLHQHLQQRPGAYQIRRPAFHIYFSAFIFMTFQMAGRPSRRRWARPKRPSFLAPAQGLHRGAFDRDPAALWNLGTDGVFLAEPISNVIAALPAGSR
jgi:hypothetical protein